MTPPRLYLVTDRHRTAGRALLDVVEAALRGGADAVQLREKDMSGRELFELAQATKALCNRYRARLLINDRIDIALAVEADGVHLPANSFRPQDARLLLGAQRCIGVSTHSPAEAREAFRCGADFAVLGPIYATASKLGYGSPLGLPALRAVSAEGPVIAIGGVSFERLAELRAAGARGVAVIGAILEAQDPQAAARQLCAG